MIRTVEGIAGDDVAVRGIASSAPISPTNEPGTVTSGIRLPSIVTSSRALDEHGHRRVLGGALP